jgi:lipopolysaccharide/colanic/teichoic acid biosynthesis glycosyltransferase
MGLIGAMLLAILAVVGATLTKLFADETKAWIPWLTERMVRRAIGHLPPDQRERFNEEWRSHLNETPGELSKLFVAIGVVIASKKMTLELSRGERSIPLFADAFKQSMDFGVALALAISVAPCLLLVALAIRLDGGPVLYRQTMVGLNGRTFSLIKFRTIATDMGTRDPLSHRTTAVGRFVRMLSIDELPLIWNVLRGDMSLVGPRPERPLLVSALSTQIPCYRERLRVRPGITGWAQINYPYSTTSVEDAHARLSFDLYYVKNRSFLFDIRILLSTVRLVLFTKDR